MTMLTPSLPAVSDPKDDALPSGLPPVIDAHVHLFPDKLFAAVHQWFDTFGWPIRHWFGSEEILSFLFDRGVSYIVGLQTQTLYRVFSSKSHRIRSDVRNRQSLIGWCEPVFDLKWSFESWQPPFLDATVSKIMELVE
jgi:hypothetical protein